MTGLSLMLSELPHDVVTAYPNRVYERLGHAEVQFHWWHTPALLPVQWRGDFRLLPWGCKDRRSRLPQGGWISVAQVETGALATARPEEVIILRFPKVRGHEVKGVDSKQGVHRCPVPARHTRPSSSSRP